MDIITILTVIGFLLCIAGFLHDYYTPKHYRCSRCGFRYTPKLAERTANFLGGQELRPLCPACIRADSILRKDRNFPRSVNN
jgi:rubredoxin